MGRGRGYIPVPRVRVTRIGQRTCSPVLRRTDIEHALGDSFAAVIPNHYNLVREAIDRGVPLDEVKPGNKITLQIKKLIAPPAAAKSAAATPILQKLKLSLAR